MSSLPVHKPFPLLRLPAEIRDCIWKYVVVNDGDIVIRQFILYKKSPETGLRSGSAEKVYIVDEEPRQTSLLAVAFTCRRLYLEVTPVYYSDNVFRPDFYDLMLRGDKSVREFANAIGPRNASTITDLHVYPALSCHVDDCLMLLPNVKRLHFEKKWEAGEREEMTLLAQSGMSAKVVYGRDVWGPDMWKLYPETSYVSRCARTWQKRNLAL